MTKKPRGLSRERRTDPDRREADSRHRAERKRDAKEKLLQAQADQIQPSRADGRPLYFLVAPHEVNGATCYYCNRIGLLVQHHRHGQVVMNDPANPPEGCEKGEMHTICRPHLPENAVIFNPDTGMLHNKAGDQTWKDGT